MASFAPTSPHSMFVIEISIFILFAGAICAWLLIRERIEDWRYQRRADRISDIVNAMCVLKLEDAINRFGAMAEEVSGESGRSLHIWRVPPASGIPKIERVVIITLTADSQGVIVDAEWHRW